MKKKRIKRGLSLILAAALMVLLPSCAGEPEPAPEPGSRAAVLDGKKVLFVGCSYTYYGGTVIKSGDYIHSQAERANDQGYFYQLCKANGAQVEVTDWCYGGHDLTDLFDGSCDATQSDKGYDHLADLTDRWFDYVILQEIKEPGNWSAEDYFQNVKGIMDLFRQVNPEVKFLYNVHDGVYTGNYSKAWKDSVRLIEQEGATIVDWGTLVWDVANGKVTVPGAVQQYNKSSFIVSQSASDGYHPNLLSGYLSALMTYCAITGETAVGQNYDFCLDFPLDDSYFDLKAFSIAYYWWDDPSTAADERKSNLEQIFRSPEDMTGLQTLADTYLAKGSWAVCGEP